MRDPYEVLEVGRDATDADVKAAFRRLAVKHHPDKNPDDDAAHVRFKELNAAYQLLSDPDKRAAYDRYGEAAFRAGGTGPGDFAGFESVFGDILNAFGIRNKDRGAVRKHVRLSFEEAAQGCEKEISYERVDHCDACAGSGAAQGAKTNTCRVCSGRGRVRFQQGILPFAVERACSSCRGTGRIPSQPCSNCRGVGLMKQTRHVEVGIPAGVESGSSKTVTGGGNRVSTTGPVGDLELVIEVEPHPFFERAGDDVRCEVPISFVQAALGGEVFVPTLDGKVKLKIPPSTQPGSVLRIRGKGIPHRLRSGRGDQLVEVKLEVPTALSARATSLIEELGHELGEQVQPQQKSFVDKLKNLFG